ncbi:cytosolic phospholipase A2 epsilon-like [Alligator mississippiensis]|uniref:cytosolic phospholipase A2 epsilon-like n=1 Tax=Alligator mississippiensis TaxID=8496 RepID=UPI0009074553|nr:cytosolic phospholipase A2 epsilon-like [Alligator mississippiensis]
MESCASSPQDVIGTKTKILEKGEVTQMKMCTEQWISDTKTSLSPCYLLTVRIIRARNIHRTDVLSETDCYVSLWLPTASLEKARTKTIKNCKDPVWNETFYYRIQSQVKNVLELAIYDDDVVTQDDHLFTVHFDVAKLPFGEPVLMYFKFDTQGKEELEVEFTLDQMLGPLETIVTNGVLVSREMCCLEVQVDEKKKRRKPSSRKDLSLSVKGSHEETQDIMFGYDTVFSSSCPTTFHYVKYKQPVLDIKLSKKHLPSSFHTYACNTKGGPPHVNLNSLPVGEKITVAEDKRFDLHVKAENCPGDLDMRLGFDLCWEEQDFLKKRKKHVASALKKVLHLEQDLQDYETPVIAIMTTGGGMRSLTTTYGSLSGLKKLNLLDCATYVTGLSGTTWTMANLYQDADWSQKDLDEKINEAQKQATKCKLGSFSLERLKYYKQQLSQRKTEGHRTSFIDLWGLIIEYLLHDGKDNHKLSDQREAVNQGQNPLPIYTALNVKENYSTWDFKEWMEFTPYEVGFLKYGAFIRSEDFGSEFFMGRLIKKLPESRICYLEGMWSSIFSLNLIYNWTLSHSSEDFWHRWTQDRVDCIEEEPILPTRPHELKTRLFKPAGPLSQAIRGVMTERLTVARYHNFLKGLQMHNDYLNNDNFCRWKDTVLGDSPNQLTETESYLSLVDTGFFINTSTPPLLRPQRKVDVILHLNYSAGSQILPLDQSCKYYSELGIPFPKIEVSEEDRKNLKECYLFDGAETPGAPILLFFPLVNDTFQNYKAPGVKRSDSEMEEGKVDLTSSSSPYSTYSVRYTEKDYDQLVKLCEYNILNNENLIMKTLSMAVERKRQHKK